MFQKPNSEKRQFLLCLVKCLFRMVTQDKSRKSSVKTKQKTEKVKGMAIGAAS